MKALPRLSSLATWISPPTSWASSREMERPRPVPPDSSDCRAVGLAERLENDLLLLRAGMPMPVSRTQNATLPASALLPIF